jgi:hypothetical protein
MPFGIKDREHFPPSPAIVITRSNTRNGRGSFSAWPAAQLRCPSLTLRKLDVNRNQSQIALVGNDIQRSRFRLPTAVEPPERPATSNPRANAIGKLRQGDQRRMPPGYRGLSRGIPEFPSTPNAIIIGFSFLVVLDSFLSHAYRWGTI